MCAVRLILRPLGAVLLCCVLWLPGMASALSRIDIRIGEIRHPLGEARQVTASLDAEGRWEGEASLQGELAEIARLRELPVTLSKGGVTARLRFSGRGDTLQQITAEGALRDLAFSDSAGLHAGEKIGGALSLQAQQSGGRWNWSTRVDWREGEVFWQPLYLANGGVQLRAEGWLDDARLAIQQAHLSLPGVGTAAIDAMLRRADWRLLSFGAAAANLDLAAAYPLLLKPYLDKTALGNLESAGRADLRAAWDEAGLQSFEIGLREVDVEDQGGRFALYKLQAQVPWSRQQPTRATLSFDGGRVLQLPLGAASLGATLNGYSLVSPLLRVPVLDGALSLSNVSAALVDGKWYWHLGASLSPLSMLEFSHAVGWPAMQGKLAASIPLVTYADGLMKMDGAMGLNLFDGSVLVNDLALQHPLGAAPRLTADITMRDLDLGLLTQTFSFGAISGKLDGDVRDLELSRWQPVKFDASFRSSPGSYPRKISQRAVENISALGGAGAAAAIQRSFLRFFNEFNYASIGLSCRLRNGVCSMDGVAPAQSGYVIVKGSGIPAITVMGYNRTVSWNELLERVKRITQGNAKPVIK